MELFEGDYCTLGDSVITNRVRAAEDTLDLLHRNIKRRCTSNNVAHTDECREKYNGKGGRVHLSDLATFLKDFGTCLQQSHRPHLDKEFAMLCRLLHASHRGRSLSWVKLLVDCPWVSHRPKLLRCLESVTANHIPTISEKNALMCIGVDMPEERFASSATGFPQSRLSVLQYYQWRGNRSRVTGFTSLTNIWLLGKIIAETENVLFVCNLPVEVATMVMQYLFKSDELQLHRFRVEYTASKHPD
jgi:hypothetical protein